MRVLVLGAAGQVGRAVARSLEGQHEVVVKTRSELDIGDAAAAGRVLGEARFDWIVNAAAYTAVDLAEDERDKAWAVNDEAVAVLARAAARGGARLLHISTDFVFDGAANRAYRPQDPPHPLSAYGASKLAGERQALGIDCRAVVVRTAWVYASAGRNFVLTMLRLMREREQIRVVSDQDRRADLGHGARACAARPPRGASPRGYLSLDRSRRRELVRFCRCHPGRSARARIAGAGCADRAGRHQRVSDARPPPGIQRARQHGDARVGGDARHALAPQFEDDAR